MSPGYRCQRCGLRGLLFSTTWYKGWHRSNTKGFAKQTDHHVPVVQTTGCQKAVLKFERKCFAIVKCLKRGQMVGYEKPTPRHRLHRPGSEAPSRRPRTVQLIVWTGPLDRLVDRFEYIVNRRCTGPSFLWTSRLIVHRSDCLCSTVAIFGTGNSLWYVAARVVYYVWVSHQQMALHSDFIALRAFLRPHPPAPCT